MDKEQAFKKIEAIAGKLNREHSTFTRADLAYELKDCGILCDSDEVGRLLWEAWQQSADRSILESVFTNNAGNRSLVETMQVAACLDTGKTDEALGLTNEQLDHVKRVVLSLKEEIKNSLADVVVKDGVKLVSVITGTSGVEKVQKEAVDVFQKYSNLVDTYEEARCRIDDLTSVFVDLRSDIELVFRRYSLALVDIFSDSIKIVSPELFDFNCLEWLDVRGMLKQAELQYTTVISRCSQLMGEITDNFRMRLQTSLNSYQSLNSKQLGLISAGVTMFTHYLDAYSRTTELQADLVTLKNDFRHDTTLINGDLMRLSKIVKLLNDLYIPKASIFYRNAESVFSKELNDLMDAIYQNDEVRSLKDQRDVILSGYKELERSICDEQAQIAYYSGHIEECEQLLEELKKPYEDAKNAKPVPPSFFRNMLTFGRAGRSYNRDAYEWTQVCLPVVKRYESLQVDVKLDRDEKETQERMLDEHTRKYNEMKVQMKALSQKMLSVMKVDDGVKQKMLVHLKDMVALLHLAKDILESRLDDRDVKIVNVKDFGSLQLPEAVETNLNTFTQTIKGNVNVIADNMSEILNVHEAGGIENGAMPESIAESSQELVERAAEAFNQWMKLEALKVQDSRSRQHYNKELEELKSRFKDEILAVDDRAALLRQVMSRINTATSLEDCKRGLSYLADIGADDMTEEEWNDFLSGNKTLII